MKKLSIKAGMVIQAGIAVFLPLLLTACASAPARSVVAMPAMKTKQPYEIKEVLRFKAAYVKEFKAEDDWFYYTANLRYAPYYDEISRINSVAGACPVAEIDFAIYDKETRKLISKEVIPQKNCGVCHKGF